MNYFVNKKLSKFFLGITFVAIFCLLLNIKTFCSHEIISINNITYSLHSDHLATVEKYIGKDFDELVIPSTIINNRTNYTVTSIGDRAFYGCVNLPSIKLPNTIKTIGYSAFSYCKKLESFEIPSSVVKIYDYAFDSCFALSKIIIPKSVENIGHHAFDSCITLQTVMLENPENLNSYADDLFFGCSSLKYIVPINISSSSLESTNIFSAVISKLKI